MYTVVTHVLCRFATKQCSAFYCLSEIQAIFMPVKGTDLLLRPRDFGF